MNKLYTVTIDVNVNYLKLRPLKDKGLIKIINVKIENNSNRKDSVLPTGVMGQTVLGSMVLGSEEQAKNFEKLKKIINKENIKDCIHLEAHIRDGNDYFTTEDHDILDKRKELEGEFGGLKIRTADELVSELCH